jgi:hypothetical protein
LWLLALSGTGVRQCVPSGAVWWWYLNCRDSGAVACTRCLVRSPGCSCLPVADFDSAGVPLLSFCWKLSAFVLVCGCLCCAAQWGCASQPVRMAAWCCQAVCRYVALLAGPTRSRVLLCPWHGSEQLGATVLAAYSAHGTPIVGATCTESVTGPS